MHDPAELPPDPPGMLASDAEREATVARLREAVGEGRLTLEEFAERVGAVELARTDRELAAVGRDLPAAPGAGGQLADTTHRAVGCHLVRRGPWSLPPRSAWRSVFGTIDLDLRDVRLCGQETELAIHNVFGTVTVVVPEGLEIIVEGGGLFASQKIHLPERPPAPGGPRLRISCSGPGGTLHVRAPTMSHLALRALLRGA